jgi:pimeloyl-ACP methyl ester carboxylesterase
MHGTHWHARKYDDHHAKYPFNPLESPVKIENFVVLATGAQQGIAQAFARVALGITTAAALFSTAAVAADAAPNVVHQTMPAANQNPVDSWKSVPTQTITADGVTFAYRELGKQNGGTPVVFLVHLAAVLDNWDPRIVDGIAAKRHVIAFDNRGIGASTGSASNSMEQMADDAITSIKAKGLTQVDLLGFSMGGMVAQEIVLKEPQLVRKMILAGTGPAGGDGISTVAGVANYDLLRGLLTGQDPKQFLFFSRTPQGIEAGKAFLARLQERSVHRDQEISVAAYVAQLQALRAWGQKKPADLSVVKQPVLVVNGDDDRMVPTPNTHDLARRLPNNTLIIYPDAGHGGIFQFHADFVPSALAFLGR